MEKFPIMLVEQFCEIKAHTIRMWEVRYNFLKPQRTDTNLRSYDLTALRHLLNISLLNRNGFKISALARRSGEEIEALIQQQHNEVVHKQGLVNKLLLAMLEADIDSFTALLSASVQNWGIDSVIKDVIYPFMQKAFYNKTRFLWWEQLIIEELKAKIIRGIDEFGHVDVYDKNALVFLPQKQYWDLPYLLITYIAKQQGIKVYYMGSNTSVENVEAAIKNKQPHFIVTSFMVKQETIEEIAGYISLYNPEAQLIVAGTDNASKYQPTGKEKFILNKDLFTLFRNQIQLAS